MWVHVLEVLTSLIQRAHEAETERPASHTGARNPEVGDPGPLSGRADPSVVCSG